MKKLLSVLIALAFIIPSITFADVYVNGYYRSNGTYVNGYYRSSPDSSPYNNYSYPGNTNPYTGKTATGNPDTYLNNYNNSSGSSYSYPSTSYTAPSTPSCPSNSYYDGISSCKCNYGYSASGGSCVSNDTLCHNQTGYNSSYDSLNGNCKCDYNYVIGTSGQCVSASSYCSNQLGIMSQYNGSTKQCECMSGYEYNGSSCVYKTTTYENKPSYSSDTYSIKTDYQTITTNKSTQKTDSSCKASYGMGSELKGTLCYCSKYYKWSSTINSCQIGSSIFTKYLTIGSTGTEVVNLKNFLAINGLYSGYVNTPFDKDTETSVKLFQALHNISLTGTVGPLTRATLNN